MITPVSEWRKQNEAVEIELPSGKTAKIRPVTSELLFKLKRIPDALTQQIVGAVLGSGSFRLDTSEGENFRLLLELMDNYAMTCFVEPRVVATPKKEDEIAPEDVDFADRYFLLQLLNKPAAELQSFREQQAGDVGDVDTGAGHESAPVGTPESESVGG